MAVSVVLLFLIVQLYIHEPMLSGKAAEIEQLTLISRHPKNSYEVLLTPEDESFVSFVQQLNYSGRKDVIGHDGLGRDTVYEIVVRYKNGVEDVIGFTEDTETIYRFFHGGKEPYYEDDVYVIGWNKGKNLLPMMDEIAKEKEKEKEMQTMDMEQMMKAMERNGIDLQIGGRAEAVVGGTRFGGQPDVPADFVWPTFTTDTYDADEVKERPLTFLAQFNCAELAALDKEGLLPKTGVLSFFYEMGSQRWGFDPKDAGCARVYWFEDVAVLTPADFPADLAAENHFPALKIAMEQKTHLPDWADFELGREDALEERYDEFYEERAMLEGERPDISSKLLGWPDIIQNNMTTECELVSRGHYLGGMWEGVPQQDKDEAIKNSLEQWRLLFQLDMVNEDDFELMFGDSGRLYFYIRESDLREQKFDNVWVILQCY